MSFITVVKERRPVYARSPRPLLYSFPPRPSALLYPAQFFLLLGSDLRLDSLLRPPLSHSRLLCLRSRQGLGPAHPRPAVPQTQEIETGSRPRRKTGIETDRASYRKTVSNPPPTGFGDDSDRCPVAGPP